jgi:uncharacterized protein YdbL (DUF1318 family)
MGLEGAFMDKLRTTACAGAAVVLAACVTVNIYFPAAAAEQAADKIIRDVWGEQPPQKQIKPPARKDESGQLSAPERLHALFGGLLTLVVPAAYARADINVSTPAIERLTSSMKAHYSSLQPYYRSGAVGLTRDGLLAMRDLKAVPLAERARVRQLLAEENQARNALYREIATANGHPEWEPEIRATFAGRWIANAPRGWWYQDDTGQWRQK